MKTQAELVGIIERLLPYAMLHPFEAEPVITEARAAIAADGVPVATKLDVEIPVMLQTTAFVAAWSKWKDEKRKKRQTLSKRAQEGQLRNMAKIGEARAIAAIEYSIDQGWKGLYESRDANGNGKHLGPNRVQVADDYAAQHPERRAREAPPEANG